MNILQYKNAYNKKSDKTKGALSGFKLESAPSYLIIINLIRVAVHVYVTMA